MKNIAYISWNYGKSRGDITNGPVTLHLIRLKDGRGLLKTDAEMVALGLATWN
jgi:hypothetical protein